MGLLRRFCFKSERGNMPSVTRTISQFREDHHKVMLVVAALTWGLLMPLLSLAVAAESMKIGGLPVT